MAMFNMKLPNSEFEINQSANFTLFKTYKNGIFLR